MNKFVPAFAIGLMLALPVAAPALADDCTRPPAPTVPQGATASNDQMVAASGAVKTYMAETESYLSCLQAQEALMKDQLTPELQQDMLNRYNSAVESMEAVAAEYNQAVRDYKAANPQ